MDIWDEAKRQANLEKHGVDFIGLDAFDWANAVYVEDLRQEYGEVRLIALGLLRNRVHVVVFTERPEGRRLISARKANSREIARYVQEIGISHP
ncbi:BrnT family toxin [Nitrospirillum sp. BR 11164]|uniref:BrnT family toxin n=1 Tax=Nitrospirillum sp. BR 11164 TaxID=3104324 RepID=UPI002B000434|nr:BrnT family toxin [Nitrospirillum sp. BR 11164]MEA1650705.1 BrnT family toxin [Nitrospirillum sp. BR 11164]